MIFEFHQRLITAQRITDQQFSALLLSRDPLAGRLSVQEQREIIAGSFSSGIEIAVRLLQSNPGRSPSEIAFREGLKIEKGAMTGVRLLLSTYSPADHLIVINANLLEKIQEVLFRLLPGEEADLREVLIGHELFHHVEAFDDQVFPRRYSIDLWRLGPYHHRSRIAAASEIAANCCAKQLGGISYNPLLLEAAAVFASGVEDWRLWFDGLERVVSY